MINSILNQHGEYFELIEVMNGHLLPSCRKTSFSWSLFPGSLCLAMNKRYFYEAAGNKNITGIVAPVQAIDREAGIRDKVLIIAGKADELFYFLHNSEIHAFTADRPSGENEPHRHSPSSVSDKATVVASAVIGQNVHIGDNVIVHHGCLVLDNTVIGSGTVLHPYVTVGTEGFFSKSIKGKKTHVNHWGGVAIGENCIIHTGTNISRSVNYGEKTEIGNDVHIGIHSNIAHDCKIGNNCDISAKVMLAGRVKIGRNCWIGTNAIISNALTIGEGSSIKLGSVVIKDVPANSVVSGNFAIEHERNLRTFLSLGKK